MQRKQWKIETNCQQVWLAPWIRPSPLGQNDCLKPKLSLCCRIAMKRGRWLPISVSVFCLSWLHKKYILRRKNLDGRSCIFSDFFKSGKFQVLQNYSSKKQVALGFSKILIFCFTIAIWSVVQVWSISNVTRKNTQNYGHTGRKRHCDPIFFLQFLNVLYMADICAKFKKYRWNILFKGITSRAGVINKYSSKSSGNSVLET